jgi:hypothetical protein
LLFYLMLRQAAGLIVTIVGSIILETLFSLGVP